MPVVANVCWSPDSTSDVSTAGRRFRTLNVLDAYNCQLLLLEVAIDFSLPAARVGQGLTRLVEYPARPAHLRPDNGPGFIRARLSEWGLAHVRQLVDGWMLAYNTQRPHQVLNFMTPPELKQAA